MLETILPQLRKICFQRATNWWRLVGTTRGRSRTPRSEVSRSRTRCASTTSTTTLEPRTSRSARARSTPKPSTTTSSSWMSNFAPFCFRTFNWKILYVYLGILCCYLSTTVMRDWGTPEFFCDGPLRGAAQTVNGKDGIFFWMTFGW